MIYLIRRPFGRLFTLALTISTATFFAGLPKDAAAQNEGSTQTTGSGTYVCTPAGFGNKSRCYVR